MSEDNIVLTLINQESEDLDIPGDHIISTKGERGIEDGTLLLGEDLESTSDGDIEIEHLVEEGGDGGDNNSLTHITFDVRKRTLIMLWQRTILEDYYRNGMTSASMQLHSLHQAAAEKTGLDHTVVKNWIRNRRRPAAIKSAEKLVEKINHGELPTYSSPFTISPLISSSPPPPITATPLPTQSRLHSSGHTHLTLSTGTSVSSVLGGGLTGNHINQQGFGTPDAKRLCFEPGPAALTSPIAPRPYLSSALTSTSTHHSLLSSLSSQPTFLVKIRVHGSGESDFYEIELQALTYETLIKSCAEELEVDISQISRIRKLPNILIRRDRDVMRLKDGQELEIMLKDTDTINQLNVNHINSSGNGMAMLNLPLSNDMPSLSGNINVGLHQTSLHTNGMQ